MQITSTIFFIFAIIFLFFLPGQFLSKVLGFKLSLLEDIFFSTSLGMILFTLAALLFSWLRIESLTLPFFALIDIIAVRGLLLKRYKVDKSDTLPIFVILVFALIFSVPMITSGFLGESLRLIGVNAADGPWHLTLINELKHNFPPDHPGMAGERLLGYHFLYFFLLAKISNIFNLSEVTLLYRFFSILISLLWGMGVYVLMLAWSKSRLAGVIAVFFSMFGGSFAFVSYLEGHPGLSFNSGYGILQPTASLLNPPFAISIVFLITFLFACLAYFNSKKVAWFLPIVIIAGSVSLFKVYAGIIILGGFMFLLFLEILQKRFSSIFWLLGTAALFFATYWPFASRGDRLIWYPLWAPHSILAGMSWYGYEEKVYTYSKYKVVRGLLGVELYGLYIFIVGNLGSRIIGLLSLPLIYLRTKKLPSFFSLLVLFMTSVSITIPLFFIQTGKVFETIQFAWYFLFFASIFSSFGLAFLLNLKYNQILKLVLFFLIVAITLPSAVSDINYYTAINAGGIDRRFYEATLFLRDRSSYNDTLLQVPPASQKTDDKSMDKWFRSTTLIFPALSSKKSFLSFENLDYKNLDVKSRLDFIKLIVEIEEEKLSKERVVSLKEKVNKGLTDNRIVYLYSDHPLKRLPELAIADEIYRTPGIYIYEVN